MYEASLVSADTPWDRFRREHPSATDPALNPWTNTEPAHISRLALFGAHLFNDRAHGATNIRCSNCHEQAELTDASVRQIARAANGPVRNRDGKRHRQGLQQHRRTPDRRRRRRRGDGRLRPALVLAQALPEWPTFQLRWRRGQ
jgi:cytochrome c peroxidase